MTSWHEFSPPYLNESKYRSTLRDMKHFYLSWTFWFGVTQIAMAGVGYLSGLMDPQACLALAITGATSIGLRAKTSKAITL